MSRSSCLPALFLFLFLLSSAQPALAQSQDQDPDPGVDTPPPSTMQNGVLWLDPNAGVTDSQVPASARLTYFGGPVISNVRVVQVLWGSGSYHPQVFSTTTPSIASFFTDITNSAFMDMLTEYNTPFIGGTGQTIGHGTFDGQTTIVPRTANNGSTITDAQIQSELLFQINTGHLPAPIVDSQGNVNTLYMIYFPSGKTIIDSGGKTSCVAGGFCAYHGTSSNTNTFQSRHLLYGVHPDLQTGGCSKGCGFGTVFENYTSVSSHEFAEAITDADIGIATTFAAPLAWYDRVTNAEIGDICNGQHTPFTANGTTYTIQTEFSNAHSACITPPDFTLSASPANLVITPGGSAGSIITEVPSGSFPGPVTLSASGMPDGVTASFDANTITSGTTLVLATTPTAALGTVPITITGTSGAVTHTTTITLTTRIPASPTSGPAPLTVTFSTGSNFDHWDYGDGQTSAGQKSLTHTYQAAGVYTATPFFKYIMITRSVPPVIHETIVAGVPVTITVF